MKNDNGKYLAKKSQLETLKRNADLKRKIMPYPLYDELLTLVNDENAKIF